MKENICHFQISMNDVFLWQVEKPREYILNNRLGILFGEVMLSSEFGLKIAAIAEFGYDIAISVGSENLEAL